MGKNKFVYQRYDYSNILKKKSFSDYFPRVYKVFAKTIASEVVSVSPMDEPVGILTYIDSAYNENISKGPSKPVYMSSREDFNKVYSIKN